METSTQKNSSHHPALDFLAPTLSQNSLEALYAAAHAFYSNGQYEQARHFFRLLTLKDGAKAKHWKGLAACDQLLKNYQSAIDYWGVAALLDENDYTTHLQAACCFFACDELSSAFTALEAAEIVAKGEPKALKQIDLLRQSWKKKV